jgi:adenosylcobinamide-phosphate synthase
MEQFLFLLLLALVLEGGGGYPQAIYQRIGHPVTWIGELIGRLEARWNGPDVPPERKRFDGVLALVIMLGVCGGVAWLIHATLWPLWILGPLLLALLQATLLAQRSLYDHVARVRDALEDEGLEAGRAAVGQIVGRDTAVLDEAGVARAAIESLAENFADGVVAPAFWLGCGGLVAGVVYKAINTADSMIGHLNARYRDFGWAAARLDDLVNLPGSRLAALWLIGAAVLTRGASAGDALRSVGSDARKHRSPNAGWPEAAMAGALGLQLAGPRVYGGETVEDAYMGSGGAGRREATADDIERALVLYRNACLLQGAVIAALVFWLVVLP